MVPFSKLHLQYFRKVFRKWTHATFVFDNFGNKHSENSRKLFLKITFAASATGCLVLVAIFK